jgi:hypothetical protein
MGFECRRQRWVLAEIAGHADHVGMLQEHEATIAIVIRKRAERLRSQSHLGM